MSQLDDHTLTLKLGAQEIYESATIVFWHPDGSDYHIQRIIDEYDNMRESIEYFREHLESSKE